MENDRRLGWETVRIWAALVGLVLLLGLAGGQDRAGEERAEDARAAAIERAAP